MNDYPMPFMQNISAQQQGLQQAMQQGNQLANQALGSQQGGFDPMKMAQMLRQGGGTQLSTDQMNEIKSLGSNPMNKLSGYNTGMFGWGNYGE